MENSADEVTREQLVDDFNAVAADVEALLTATASQGGEKLAEIRARVEESLKGARAGMARAQTALVVKAKSAGKTADVYVHENPWKIVGAAAGIALVIGVLIGRR
ncbi:MAG: DUF883 family protein [Burkholderiales bacterium]